MKHCLPRISSPLLSNLPGISHGFFTRQGGLSKNNFKSLNVVFNGGDSPDNVHENRNRILSFFQKQSPEAQLITSQQYHSADVHVVTHNNKMNVPPCDALITKDRRLILGVSTADCGPILFVDPNVPIIAAVHSGWKGALNGIIDNTINKMCQMGAAPKTILATLGPCIHRDSYEVDDAFRVRFLDQNASYRKYFVSSQKSSHFYFNLPFFILDRLLNKGITASSCNRCTFIEKEMFFSFRRSRQLNEVTYGRQLSAILLQ